MPRSFDDDYSEEEQRAPKVSLKIKKNEPAKSKPNNVNFDELATKVHSKDEEYKKKFFEYSTMFKKIVGDSILEENKTELSKSVEKDIVNKLINLASEMNSDENQPEGIGSIALITLMLKICLSQRDSINELKYKIYLLENSKERK
jgi:hypothetical protein